MIVLDTNVLSETLRPGSGPKVLVWLGGQPRAALFTTAVTRAEILYGLRLLPEGSRRAALSGAVEAIFNEDFDGRLLSFDSCSGLITSAAGRDNIGRFGTILAENIGVAGTTISKNGLTLVENGPRTMARNHIR